MGYRNEGYLEHSPEAVFAGYCTERVGVLFAATHAALLEYEVNPSTETCHSFAEIAREYVRHSVAEMTAVRINPATCTQEEADTFVALLDVMRDLEFRVKG